MARYFIHIAYKGTNYSGWQIQPNAPSVQETLQSCISTILRQEISVVGAGRTDAGVHASSFYIHFDYNSESTPIDYKNFTFKLNSFLPNDIKIFGIYPVKSDAHARFDAISRKYKYYISKEKEIFKSDYCWYKNYHLNTSKMNIAAKELFNYNDFTSFSKLHTDVKTNICKIHQAEWSIEKNFYIFTIKADRFLRNMVRSIVGTLIEVGSDKMTLTGFKEVIESQDRRVAGVSVPAKGLFLDEIIYPYNIG